MSNHGNAVVLALEQALLHNYEATVNQLQNLSVEDLYALWQVPGVMESLHRLTIFNDEFGQKWSLMHEHPMKQLGVSEFYNAQRIAYHLRNTVAPHFAHEASAQRRLS